MRQINLNQRELRMLRDTLTAKEEGYDYTDLLRLDFLAKKMTSAMGEYATAMAELAREEKQIRRKHRKGEATDLELNKALNRIRVDVDEAHEAAEAAQVQYRLEDGDWKLVVSVLEGVQRWTATDDIRETIMGMRDAVGKAEVLEEKPDGNPSHEAQADGKVSKMRRTG